jgi:tetratricopeptide (TPR) repeat protein
LGAGHALLRLHRSRDALQKLLPALEVIQLLARSEQNATDLVTALARIHRMIGDAMLDHGDETGALGHYREALAAADDLVRLNPTNLYFQRQRGDALESLWLYYAGLARRRREFEPEARLWIEKSLAIWRDWTRRKVATPYAGVRERQAATLLAKVGGR